MKRLLCIALALVLALQIAPSFGSTAEAAQPTAELIVARIALNPAAPKTGEKADVVVFVQNVGSASIDLSGFTASVAVGGATHNTGAYTGTLASNEVIELKYSGYTVTEGSNIFTISINGGRGLAYEFNTRGAHLGYVEYEAEDGYYSGELMVPTIYQRNDLASESRGGKAVALAERGQFIQWVSAADANALTIRASIPEGAQRTISLYVNGEFREKITLNSTRLWPRTNSPHEEHFFGPRDKLLYRESHKLLTDQISKGDVVRIQKDANDTAAYYYIDFIELEQAVKKERPSNFVSIADFGAVEGGAVDCTDALYDAMHAAIRDDKAGIWFPEGSWGLATHINLRFDDRSEPFGRDVDLPEGFVFAGAGIWYTRINRIATSKPLETVNFGFQLFGSTATFCDFMMDGMIEGSEDGYTYIGGGLGTNFGPNSRMEDLWIKGTGVGIWAGSEVWNGTEGLSPEQTQSRGTLIQNIRIRETFADGINLHRGRLMVTVRNVNCRSTGDDSFAMWSLTDGSTNPGIGNQSNTFRNCTSEMSNSAHGFVLAGGRDNQIIDSIVRDNVFGMPGISVNTNGMSAGYPDGFSGDNRIERVTVDRCGWASEQIAKPWPYFANSISIQASLGTEVSSINFKDIDIRNADHTAVKFIGDVEASFENLRIDGYCTGRNATGGSGAAVLYDGAKGKVYWKNLSISGGGNNRPEELRNFSDVQAITIAANQPIPMPSAFPKPTLLPAPNINTAAGWARDNVNSAFRKGFIPTHIVNNYSDVISRADFCRMAVRYLEYATGKSIDAILTERELTRRQDAFSDTKDPDILAAFALGITTGTRSPSDTAPGTFTPNGSFTREMAATMLARVSMVLGADTANAPNAGYTDIDAAANWARDSINYCFESGIMTGTSTTPLRFSPKDAFTRQQSIATFDRMG